MLAHVAGSISTDLNVWERMTNPCVSQAVCHSATTARVVWLLALDFIFTPCVSPCPGILILDVVQTRSLLDGSHTGAFDFSRLCLYQHGLGGRGELLESNSSFGKYCDPGDSWVYLLSIHIHNTTDLLLNGWCARRLKSKSELWNLSRAVAFGKAESSIWQMRDPHQIS